MVNKAKKQGTNYETNIVNRLNKVENFKSQRFAEGGSKDLGDIQLFSNNDAPILIVVALRNVFAIAPPIIILSTFLIKLSRSCILVEIFDPPMIAMTGLIG